MSRPPLRDRSSAVGCLHRARGWLLVISSLAIGLLGWWVMTMLAASLRENPDHAADVGPYVRWMTGHASIMLVLAMPPLAIGVWLAVVSSRRSVFWFVWVLGIVWEFALFAAVLIAFIQFLVPLYQYQPL
jgi:hypothetical protein